MCAGEGTNMQMAMANIYHLKAHHSINNVSLIQNFKKGRNI